MSVTAGGSAEAGALGIAIHKEGRPGRPSVNLHRARHHLRPLSQELRIRTRTLSALPSPSARRAVTSRAGQAGRPTAGGAATQCRLLAYRERLACPEAGRTMSRLFPWHHHAGHLVQVVSLAGQ